MKSISTSGFGTRKDIHPCSFNKRSEIRFVDKTVGRNRVQTLKMGRSEVDISDVLQGSVRQGEELRTTGNRIKMARLALMGTRNQEPG